MDSSSTEIIQDFHPFFRIYKDGRVERFMKTDLLPPSDDPETGVRSKDVVISPEKNNLSARLFLPKTANPNRKLPLLVYIHGGAFSVESAFSTLYHNYVRSLAAESDVIAVSIEYRLAPEHPIPACYDDTWTALQWVAQHANTSHGPEPWLNDHADFERLFLAGDSAGANIAHNAAVRAGVEGLGSKVRIVGVVLVHPFFGNNGIDKLWMFICPGTSGADDPRLNPGADPGSLAKLGCTRVLVCLAGNDHLRERGWAYYEALRKCGWGGELEIVETEGEGHVFHLFDPNCEKAGALMKRVASFINQD